MKRDLWPMRDSVKDYFPLPKEVFSLDLSAAEIAIYAYLWFSTAEHYRCEVEQQIVPRLGDVPLKNWLTVICNGFTRAYRNTDGCVRGAEEYAFPYKLETAGALTRETPFA